MDTIMKTRNRITAAVAVAILLAFLNLLAANEFDILGRIEAVRKWNEVTVIFDAPPQTATYYIIEGGTIYGTLEVRNVEFVRNGNPPYRAVATYRLANQIYAKLVRAGIDVGLPGVAGRSELEFGEAGPGKEKALRAASVSEKDRKAMVLVPEGRFVFGSSTGDRDESPEQVLFLDGFYIDRNEVSNEEYARFIGATNSKPPLSWKGPVYGDGEKDLPVSVTYHEAEAYARWTGKRLPTEEEWEKAARGTGSLPGMEGGASYNYPWGRDFDPERGNCAEFWADEKTGAHIKMRFEVTVGGLMPVTAFDPEGASPCGAINMAGNAREWTSSWYMPYRGNKSRQGKEYRMYGKQFKVVRGGAWYSTRYRMRVSSREVGGVPNLHSDNLAGFRCVRDPDPLDYIGK